MGNLFDMDNKFVITMNRILSLLVLNLLWVITSVPIITMGASSCSLYVMTKKIVDGKEGYTIKPFFENFKIYFKKATIIWLPELAAGLLLFFDLQFWGSMTNMIALIMRGITLTLGCLYLIVLLYTTPLIADKNQTKGIIKTALFMGIKYLPQSLFLILWGGIFIVSSQLWALAALLVFTIGASVFSLMHNLMMKKVFEKELKGQEQIRTRVEKN